MNALDKFKHAETFANMPLNEKLVATGNVILLGMGITFLALVLIWALTVLMSKVIQSLEKSAETSKMKTSGASAKAPEAPKAPAVVAVEETDDLELVAVITAAVAAAMNTSVNNIHVSSITRTNDTSPTWGRAGRSELMNTRA